MNGPFEIECFGDYLLRLRSDFATESAWSANSDI